MVIDKLTINFPSFSLPQQYLCLGVTCSYCFHALIHLKQAHLYSDSHFTDDETILKKNVYHVQFVSSSLQGFEVRCQEYKWRIAVGVQEEAERIKLGAWSSAIFFIHDYDGHYTKKENKKGLNCFNKISLLNGSRWSGP